MKITLMNKKTKVLDFTFDKENGNVINIDKIYDISYAPLQIKNSNNIKEGLDKWLDERVKITNRFYDKHDLLYTEKELKKDILLHSNVLSLSDQYWINHLDDNKNWDDINYFTNSFTSISLGEYSSRDFNALSNSKLFMHSPTTTTGGQVDKTWMIDESGNRCLLKSANTFQMMEPVNEKYASKVANILGLKNTDYTLKYIKANGKKALVSSSKCFITQDSELVPAGELIENNESLLKTIDKYKKILRNDLKIEDSDSKINKMLLLDTLLVASDRHLNNFGVIRDVNTLKYIDVVPIFDNGRILGTTYSGNDYKNYSENDFDYYVFGKETNEEELLNYLKGKIFLSKEQESKLKSSLNNLDKMLKENKEYIRVNDDARKNLISVLNRHYDYIIKRLREDIK